MRTELKTKEFGILQTKIYVDEKEFECLIQKSTVKSVQNESCKNR